MLITIQQEQAVHRSDVINTYRKRRTDKNTIVQTEKYNENQTNKFTYIKTDRQENNSKDCIMIPNIFFAIKKTTFNAKKL